MSENGARLTMADEDCNQEWSRIVVRNDPHESSPGLAYTYHHLKKVASVRGLNGGYWTAYHLFGGDDKFIAGGWVKD